MSCGFKIKLQDIFLLWAALLPVNDPYIKRSFRRRAGCFLRGINILENISPHQENVVFTGAS